MNASDKQVIEKIVKDVLQNKRVPGEDRIRQIVREEIELKKSFSEKFNN